jgi:hypothetical protein
VLFSSLLSFVLQFSPKVGFEHSIVGIEARSGMAMTLNQLA